MISDKAHNLWTLKNYSHMSSCLSLNFGIIILNLTNNFPCFPVFIFSIPLFGIVITVDLVVTSDLDTSTYSSFKCFIFLLKPKMAYLSDIYIV